MKLLFINCAYPKEVETELRECVTTGWQSSANSFQWAIIDGLERSGIDYTLVCTPAVPAWPRFKSFFTPSGNITINGKCKGHYLSYFTMPALNQIARNMVLKKYIRRWCEENQNEERLYAICYTQQADMLGAAIEIKKQFPNLVVAPIITDLIENAMDFADNRKLLKRVQVWIEKKEERKLYPMVDKYILLTTYMTDHIPESKGRAMVMEGVVPWERISPREVVLKKEEVRSLLYTGTFQEFGGLRMLVDSFMQTRDPRFRLILCGDGYLRQYVERAAESDKRIVYKGLINHDEVVHLQRECTLLINPRRPNGNITKYSFPSKTMEYMSSLTPMIGYHLEGIPEEFYPYMFTPKDLSQESLTECINTTLSLPLDILQQKAKAAFKFVSENKNSEVQVKKIIEFLLH